LSQLMSTYQILGISDMTMINEYKKNQRKS
jgi:hypothetical protein